MFLNISSATYLLLNLSNTSSGDSIEYSIQVFFKISLASKHLNPLFSKYCLKVVFPVHAFPVASHTKLPQVSRT